MRESDLHYLGGLIDGEGWFGCQKVGRHYKPMFGINMTDSAPVSLISSFTGTSIHLKRWSNPGWKDQFCLRVCGQRAVLFASVMQPYCRLKRPQIDQLVRSEWETFNGRKIPEEERLLRQDIWENLRELNRKGK